MNLADDDVPEKTDQGTAEIRSRALGALKLPARLRTVLLLVDGVRPLRELKAILSSERDLMSALTSLHDLGLLRMRAPVRTSDDAAEKSSARVSRAAPAKAALTALAGIEPTCRSASISAHPASPLPDHGCGSSDDLPATVAHTNFRRARAHLANALDEYLGVSGYLLRQHVASCATPAELESLHDTIRADLTPAMGAQGAASVVERARRLAGPASVESKIADLHNRTAD